MWKSFAVTAALCVGLAAPASAATIKNGSFEDIGGQSLNNQGWQLFSSVPEWNGVPNIEIQSNKTLGSIDAQDGDRYVELETNTNATIYQDVALTAGKYLFSFFYSPRIYNTNSSNDMGYDISVGTNSVLGDMIRTAPNDDYPYGQWTEVQGRFTLDSAATVRVSLFADGVTDHSGCGSCGALIDNVSLTPVPIPANVLLLGSALFGLALLERRRRRTA